MVERLLAGGHEVVAYDSDSDAAGSSGKKGATTAGSIMELADSLDSPKIIWIMVPAGETTGLVLDEAAGHCTEGDIIIDGGNSNFRDSVERGKALADRGIHFLDAGTSGGIWGLQEGYCLMVGGSEKVFKTMEPVFQALAPPDGYGLVGPVGAGHFVKMVHNGIEYGILQAYGEGFEILRAKQEFDLDLAGISRLWNRGSVVRSWLLELLERALEKDPGLDHVAGYVEDSGEGRWAVAEAINEDVPAPVITLSLFQRFASRQKEPFSARVIAALRREFGGHGVKETD